MLETGLALAAAAVRVRPRVALGLLGLEGGLAKVRKADVHYSRREATGISIFFVSPLATLALSCVPWATPG